jgi:hypothetical protein
MSIGLLDTFGKMQLTLHAIFLIESFCARFCTTPFELRFGRKSSVSHLRPFRCKCFILNRGNLDKFESHSSDGILLGYTPYDKSYRVFNFETNTVVESCVVTSNETVACPHDVFECVGNKEMEESIFIDEKLQGFDGDEDDPLRPSTSSPEHVSAFTLEEEASQSTTSSTIAVEASQVEGGGTSSSRVLPLTFRRHIHLKKS